MRRAPIVIAGTVAGLVGVLTFHTHPTSLRLPTTPAPGTTQASGPGNTTKGRTGAGPSQSGSTRTAVGPSVNYSWGVLSVKVTVSGRKIVKVAIASLDDGDNPRSQAIDQQAIPLLEQEVMQAQSANIQGVSGASYTSAGFAQSLQAALHSLGYQ